LHCIAVIFIAQLRTGRNVQNQIEENANAPLKNYGKQEISEMENL
jgi:hypothetical protein